MGLQAWLKDTVCALTRRGPDAGPGAVHTVWLHDEPAGRGTSVVPIPLPGRDTEEVQW